MKTIIIDDEKNAQSALINAISTCCPGLELAGNASDGYAGVQLIRSSRPDLVFLDVEMPGMDGFEVLRQFDKPEFYVIFVTAHNDYAVKAFEFSALDYLLKPVDTDRLIQAVQKAQERKKVNGTNEQFKVLLEMLTMKEQTFSLDYRIVFSTHNEIVFSWLRNLIRIDADQNFSFIKLADQPNPLRIAKSIGEYEKQFEGNRYMMRVHRSHLVNLFHVKKFLPKDNLLVMTDGLKIPVAYNRREEILQRLQDAGEEA